jgi:hypothetical protein
MEPVCPVSCTPVCCGVARAGSRLGIAGSMSNAAASGSSGAIVLLHCRAHRLGRPARALTDTLGGHGGPGCASVCELRRRGHALTSLPPPPLPLRPRHRPKPAPVAHGRHRAAALRCACLILYTHNYTKFYIGAANMRLGYYLGQWGDAVPAASGRTCVPPEGPEGPLGAELLCWCCRLPASFSSRLADSHPSA